MTDQPHNDNPTAPTFSHVRRLGHSADIPLPATLSAARDELLAAYIDVINNAPGCVERYQTASDRLKALRGDA
jgi:hypothetical protein